jgi:hypothetical protein
MKDFAKPAAAMVSFELVDTGLIVGGENVGSLAISTADEKLGFPGKISESQGELSGELLDGRVRILSSSELKVLEVFAGLGEVPSRPMTVSVLERKVGLSREPVRLACKSLAEQGILGVSGKTKSRQYWLAQEVEL